MNSLTRYNYFFLFLFINWAPFQLVLLRQAGIGIIIVAIAMMALVMNLFMRNKEVSQSFCHFPQRLWLVLIFYMFLNWWFKSPPMGGMEKFTFLYGEILTPIFLMVVVQVELNKDYATTLKVLLFSFLFFVLVGTIFAQPDENDASRMLATSLGNLVPLNAVVSLMIVFELKRLGKIKTIWPVVLFLMFAIFYSSTRKALGAGVIIIIGYILSRGEANFRNRLIQAGTIILVAFVVFYVVSHLGMKERFVAGFENDDTVQILSNSTLNNFFLMLVGDRAGMYVLALELVPNHFLTGIGLRNFEIMTNFPVQLHTEYMVQLCENGIIGFAISLLMHFAILFKTISMTKKNVGNTFYLFGIIAILFLNFTTWTYNQIFALTMLAILMNNINNKKYEIKKFKAKQLGARY